MGSLYDGSYYFRSILGASDFWKLPDMHITYCRLFRAEGSQIPGLKELRRLSVWNRFCGLPFDQPPAIGRCSASGAWGHCGILGEIRSQQSTQTETF